MSAFGTKLTFPGHGAMSTFKGKADVTILLTRSPDQHIAYYRVTEDGGSRGIGPTSDSAGRFSAATNCA